MTSQEQGIYEIRIADFGLATQLKSDKDLCHHKCGTPSFIAPECLKGKGYSKKFDIFSAGSLMYNLTTGEYLFSDQPEMNILFANRRCNLSHISNKINHLSKDGQDLMLSMLNPKPKLRFDCKQALNHPWFQSDKEALVQGLYINKSIQRMQFMRYPVINTLHINQSNAIKFSLNQESSTPQKNGQKMFNLNIMDNNLQNQSNDSNSPINLNYFSNTTKNCQNNNLTVSVRNTKQKRLHKNLDIDQSIPSFCIIQNKTPSSSKSELRQSSVNYYKLIESGRNHDLKQRKNKNDLVNQNLDLEVNTPNSSLGINLLIFSEHLNQNHSNQHQIEKLSKCSKDDQNDKKLNKRSTTLCKSLFKKNKAKNQLVPNKTQTVEKCIKEALNNEIENQNEQHEHLKFDRQEGIKYNLLRRKQK
eukprot:403358537